MKWWDRLRTAVRLAERVEELERAEHRRESEHTELVQEWTDFLDKQNAREERERKRLQRDRARREDPGSADPVARPDAPMVAHTPSQTKAALWAAVRARAANGGKEP